MFLTLAVQEEDGPSIWKVRHRVKFPLAQRYVGGKAFCHFFTRSIKHNAIVWPASPCSEELWIVVVPYKKLHGRLYCRQNRSVVSTVCFDVVLLVIFKSWNHCVTRCSLLRTKGINRVASNVKRDDTLHEPRILVKELIAQFRSPIKNDEDHVFQIHRLGCGFHTIGLGIDEQIFLRSIREIRMEICPCGCHTIVLAIGGRAEVFELVGPQRACVWPAMKEEHHWMRWVP
mmetsp:Transcript_114660/g.222691  ORF Transcript_114660/g.222691 Transcript_114660/m.222691 type:complete len:230 (+) Transcript_114660:197-886(+)